MCNKGHMTLIFKLDLVIMKVIMQTKDKDTASWHSRVIMLKDMHIGTSENHYLPYCHIWKQLFQLHLFIDISQRV